MKRNRSSSINPGDVMTQPFRVVLYNRGNEKSVNWTVHYENMIEDKSGKLVSKSPRDLFTGGYHGDNYDSAEHDYLKRCERNKLQSLSVEMAIEIQQEQLVEYRMILKPMVFSKLKELVELGNDESNRLQNPALICRGDNIREILSNYFRHNPEETEIQKKTYVVVVFGYWGKGSTVAEAATNCFKAGAGKTDKALIYLYSGEGEKEITVDGMGNIHYPLTMESFRIGNGFKLGNLMDVDKEKKA